MVLLGTLPYLYKPEAKLIANIGLGSGVTTHTLLHKPEMERLDTIEIEQAVVNAASLFRPNVDNMFTDSRSKIHIEDAKTFFATSRQKYDVVVSEPPNPWVSGVAGLFTEEFYSDIQRYMTQDAVFVQWIHLYEISPELVGTVYAALRSRFPHIDLYRVSGSDIVFVASQSELSADFGVPFKYEGFSEQLAEVSILNEADLKFRRMAGTRKLDLFFAPFSNNANSDYYPILDIGAAKTRFMKTNATGVLQLAESRSLNYISNEAQHDFEGITEDPLMSSIGEAINIQQFYKTLNEHDNGEKAEPLLTHGPDYSAANLHQALAICHTTETESEIDLLSERIVSIAQWAYPLSNTEQFKYLIARLDQCKSSLNKDAQQFIEINNAWTNNDLLLVKQLTDTWLEDKENIEGSVEHHLLQLGLTSRVALDNWEGFEGTYDNKRIELGNNLELNALWHLVVSLQDEN